LFFVQIDLDLTNYKKYIDSEMLMVLGQMDCPSKILDYLYLGSEWNACNFEELQELGYVNTFGLVRFLHLLAQTALCSHLDRL